MENLNSVSLTGNLTRDPELKQTQSGTDVANMRLAVNTRRKDAGGEWVDKPNFFNVTVWGGRARACAEHLKKGRGIAVHGQLDWREWQTEGGEKRQDVSINAQHIEFLPSGQQSNGQAQEPPAGHPDTTPVSTPPITTPAAAPAAQQPLPASDATDPSDDPRETAPALPEDDIPF